MLTYCAVVGAVHQIAPRHGNGLRHWPCALEPDLAGLEIDRKIRPHRRSRDHGHIACSQHRGVGRRHDVDAARGVLRKDNPVAGLVISQGRVELDGLALGCSGSRQGANLRDRGQSAARWQGSSKPRAEVCVCAERAVPRPTTNRAGAREDVLNFRNLWHLLRGADLRMRLKVAGVSSIFRVERGSRTWRLVTFVLRIYIGLVVYPDNPGSRQIAGRNAQGFEDDAAGRERAFSGENFADFRSRRAAWNR